MRAWLAAALVAAAGHTLANGPAQPDRLCAQTAPSAEPRPATVPGCDEAQCTAVQDQTLCTCSRGEAFRFERRRGGAVLQQWATDVSPMHGPGAFEVTQADVDGDGQPEWLVSRLLGVSNGLGVSTHTLCVLWPREPRRAPACREVKEWKALTLLIQEPGQAACSLMDAHWQAGHEPGRGPGTYASGSLWRLQAGRWQPVPTAQRQARARRLLQKFQSERATLPQRNTQRLWYQHPAATAAPCPGALCPQLER